MPSGISADDVHKQLVRILNSPGFSGLSAQLLDYIVKNTLAGRAEAITERAIALKVLGKETYNTKSDASVRMAFQRLREKLREYYYRDGNNDSVLFLLAVGCYTPRFRRNRTIDTIRPRSEKAWDLYIEARRLWGRRTPKALRSAIAYLEQALEEEDTFADAHAALAECYAFLSLSGQAPHEVMPLAKRHVDAALSLDEDNPTAHAVRGFIACAYDWNWDEAEVEFELAIALDRRSTSAYCWYASYLVAVGRNSEAILQCRRAQASETSTSLVTNSHVAKILHVAGEHDRALNLLIHMIDEAPTFFLTHWHLGLILLQMGQPDRAILELQSAVELSGQMPSVLASLAFARAAIGEREEAQRLLKQLIDRRVKEYVAASDVAAISGALGALDEAFWWLDQARQERAIFLTWLKAWPLFGPLRADPRYQDFLKSIGLLLH